MNRNDSRRSSKHSNRDEDTMSLDERQLLESFKSITDIFENELQEDEILMSRSVSEDADSVDEEVRRIMSKDEKQKEKSESKDGLSSDEDDEDDDASTVLTETESESESDQELTDSEELDDDEASKASEDNWYPEEIDEDEEQSELSEEEFDLDKYIDSLCLQSTDEEESDDNDVSDSDSTYSKDTKKAVKKVMRKVTKNKSDGDDTATESERDSDDETLSNPDVDRDDLATDELQDDVSGDEREKGSEDGSDDDSSVRSSGESEIEYNDDDDEDDDDDSSTGTSQNGDDLDDSRDSVTSPLVGDVEILPPTSDPDNQLHDTVRKYYMGLDRERCPAKLDVHEDEIGQMKLDNTLSSRNVVSLRWPFSNYYVKEVEVEQDEQDSIFDEGLVPMYKSMQASSSFPGRRRDVMSGRVWWVEWWASNLSDSDKSVEDLQGKDGNDELQEIDNESLTSGN